MGVAPEPSEFRAGDTVKWTVDTLTGDYPASGGWGLTYYFRNALASFDAAGVAAGDAFDVTIAAGDSADIAPGEFRWIARVDKTGEIYTVGTGTTIVKPDLASAGAVDDRDHAEKVLAAIEAVIENRATKDQSSYTIGNRSLARTPMADLIALRDKYDAEVRRLRQQERLKKGLSAGRTIHTRFV